MAWSLQNARPPLGPGAGMINLSARSGLTISFRWQSQGVFANLAARTLYFEIAGFARFALAAGANPTERLIVIPAEVAAELPLETATPFVVRDETGPGDPDVIWAGMIKTFGYATEPT
jgi:hypothetical protein